MAPLTLDNEVTSIAASVLEMVARGAPLQQTLDTLARSLESATAGKRASILLLDGDCLRHGSAPSLPDYYNRRIDGLQIGPNIGSCGTAAFTGERVVVEDVIGHPYWRGFEELADRVGFRGCWSMPVFSSSGQVLGTFAFYTDAPGAPAEAEIEQIRSAAHLAGIAIQRQREEDERRLDLALREVRNATLRMAREEEWLQVARCFHSELDKIVPIRASTIQLVDLAGDRYAVYGHRNDDVVQYEGVPRSLKDAIDGAVPVYRRNPAEIASYGDQVSPVTRSIVDVPFLGGTVAMSSSRENAFGDRDIRVLEHFAETLSAAYLRLDDLKKLKDQARQLQQAQKMDAIGQLTAGVAHNFNNALGGATVNLFLAQQHVAPQGKAFLQEAERALQQASEMVRQLMTYARIDDGVELLPLDLAPLMRNVKGICEKTFDRKIDIEIDLPADLPRAIGDKTQLEQVLLNLCLNARDAVAPAAGGRPLIRLGADRPIDAMDQVPPRAAGYVRLQVADNGPGMDEETKAQIFDPFFTTKPVDEGTGLGLSTVYGIVQQHQGHIECRSRPGAGATFSIYLPATEAPVSAADEAPSETPPETPPARPATILLIDDDDAIISGISRLLEQQKYQVLIGRDGQEGLELFKRRSRSIDLVILDLSLPKISGDEILDELTRLDPAVKVIIFTGYMPDRESFDDRVLGVVQKPPQFKSFLRQIGAAIAV